MLLALTRNPIARLPMLLRRRAITWLSMLLVRVIGTLWRPRIALLVGRRTSIVMLVLVIVARGSIRRVLTIPCLAWRRGLAMLTRAAVASLLSVAAVWTAVALLVLLAWRAAELVVLVLIVVCGASILAVLLARRW
jgi:hypothetical protein